MCQCGGVSQSDLIGTTEAAAMLGWSRAKVKRDAKPGDSGAYLFHRAVIEMVAARPKAGAA
jgi:hypothetical protein